MTEAARRNLDRFGATSAAKALDDDPRTWTVVEWTWSPGPPLRVYARSELGDVLEFTMDEAGVWRMHHDANDPKEPPASL